MPRRHWNGRDIIAAVSLLLQRDGTDCWLCHHHAHPSSRSVDHVIPFRDRPDLDRIPTNWRLAHLHPAGHTSGRGCPVAQCQCPGNTGRRATPWTPPPSRDW